MTKSRLNASVGMHLFTGSGMSSHPGLVLPHVATMFKATTCHAVRIAVGHDRAYLEPQRRPKIKLSASSA